MADWHPITTAPKDGRLVDLWVVGTPWWIGSLTGMRVPAARAADMRWINGAWRTHSGSYQQSGLPAEIRPTHWRPVPKPPPVAEEERMVA